MSDPTLDQSEIDALLADVGGAIDGGSTDAGAMDGGIDDILSSMGGADAGMAPMGDDLAAMIDAQPLEDPAPAAKPAAAPKESHADDVTLEFSKKNIEVLLDVPLQVVVELGRSDMPIQKVLELGPGSIVELNRMSGEPINILVNGKLVARGEVVVVDENFGVRITSIISPMERLSQLN